MTRHFLSAEEQARYAEARLDAVRAMARVASEQGCAFAVVCGDVFDSNHLDRTVVVRALEALRSFTVPVYLLPANHDPLNAASVYRSPEFLANVPAHVTVLATSEPLTVTGGVAEVVGAPWESKHPLADLAGRACADLPTRGSGAPPRILVAHGAVDAGAPDTDNPALIRLAAAEAALAAGSIDYIALGDRHSTTPIGTTNRIWYSGTPLVTDYTELDPNNVLVVEIAGPGAEPVVTRHRVGTWAFVREHFHVDGTEGVNEVIAWLDALQDKRSTVVKLSFEGTLNLTEKTRLDDALAHHESLFAALETWERNTDLAVLADAADLDNLALSGFASTTLSDLQAGAAAGGEHGQVAQDALDLLFRLAR